MRYNEILTEFNWKDRRPTLFQKMNKFHDKFIHITMFPKLGIRPTRVAHRDPKGMYFYPIRYLLDKEPDLIHQYPLDSEYYYIVDINFATILNLGTITEDEIVKLAKENGWLDDYITQRTIIKKQPDEYRNGHLRDLLQTPGVRFFSIMDNLVNKLARYTWHKLLKGTGGIFDPGFGLFHVNEKQQVVVFKQNLISILDHGKNTYQSHNILLAAKLKEIYPQAQISFKHKNLILKIDHLVIEIKDGYYRLTMTITNQKNITVREYHITVSQTTRETIIEIQAKIYAELADTPHDPSVLVSWPKH